MKKEKLPDQLNQSLSSPQSKTENKSAERWLACGALLGLLLAAVNLLPQNTVKLEDDTVAQVNGYSVSLAEYQLMFEKISDIVPSGVMPIEQQQRKLLDSMIDEYLLAQQAIVLGLPLNDSRLRKMLAMSLTEWQTTEILSEQVEKQTLADFYDDNSLLFSGNELVQVAHMRFVCQSVICSKQGAAYQRAQQAFKKLGQGQSFTEIKQQYADKDLISLVKTPMSYKELHHKLGGTITKEAQKLAEQQYSKPLVSGQSYHLIKVTKRQAGLVLPFEQVQEQVLTVFQQRKRLKKMKHYLEELKRDAEILVQEELLPVARFTSLNEAL